MSVRRALHGGRLAVPQHEVHDGAVELGRILVADGGKQPRQRREVVADGPAAPQDARQVVAAHQPKVARLGVLRVRGDDGIQHGQPVARVAQAVRRPGAVLGAQQREGAAVRRQRRRDPGVVRGGALPVHLRHAAGDGAAGLHRVHVQVPHQLQSVARTRRRRLRAGFIRERDHKERG
jgi:hypothetical protein